MRGKEFGTIFLHSSKYLASKLFLSTGANQSSLTVNLLRALLIQNFFFFVSTYHISEETPVVIFF